MADENYLNTVRGFCALYTSERRDIAASLGLPAQGRQSDLEWTKLVLMAAKERGELPRVNEAIQAAMARR